MKSLKTLKSIKASNDENTLLLACAILEHRPNLGNKKRQGICKREQELERFRTYKGFHHGFFRGYSDGFEEGYRYAIERLKRHSG